MMKGMVGGGALLLAAALFATVMLGSAWAQQSASQTLRLTPSRDSGVSGTATLEDTDNGVRVQLALEGLPKDGVEHLAHIHSDATCADDRLGQGGPIEFPLESVTAQGGTGSSTTTIPNVTLAQLFDGSPRYINVHGEQTGQGVPPGIACADLSRAQEQTKLIEQTQPLPSSGGPLAGSALLPALALLFGSGILGYAILRRR